MADASSGVATPRAANRRPLSQTAAITPRAIINPYARSWSEPMWMAPESGLGMKAQTAAITAGTLAGA